MQNIENKFFRILKYMGISEKLIIKDASFSKDFEFNEFQFSCLYYYISTYFNIEVYQEDYSSIDTIEGVIVFIRRKVNETSRSK